jgi:hypothetical protein
VKGKYYTAAGWITSKYILRKCDGVEGGFISLKRGTSGELLWTGWWTSGLHNTLETLLAIGTSFNYESSSVSIVTRLRAGDWGIAVRFLAGARNPFPVKAPKAASRPIQLPVRREPATLFPGVKLPGRESHHSPQSRAGGGQTCLT